MQYGKLQTSSHMKLSQCLMNVAVFCRVTEGSIEVKMLVQTV